MIGILNVNPCVDKTVFVESFAENSVAICHKYDVHSGGKGVNVARVLKSLGDDAIVFSVFAGETGKHIERMMNDEGLTSHSVWVEGLSRTYTTVVDKNNKQFAIKERGPEIKVDEVESIKQEFLKFLKKIDFLCISDTVSCENMKHFSAYAVKEAKKRNIKVFLDTDNEALLFALNAKPDIVKPNNDEIAAIIGKRENEGEYLDFLAEKGVAFPIVSLGERGCISICDGKRIKVIPPKVETVSAVGCGDSFIGGFIHSFINGCNGEQSLKYASAAGAANALDIRAAYIEKDTVEKLLKNVIVKGDKTND